jgi:hypothetical protein
MSTPIGFAELPQPTLATLVPELLLCGHLIDRAGMPHVLGLLGSDGVRDLSIDEWMGASPIYTKRMRAALGYSGDDVETIFKGLQLDIGAPPQFMDFRYTLHDPMHGEFSLAHCGALMDVEPMGDELVHTMCHHIEDPTFDATAAATNPRARMRPIHRPPRVPAGRSPHCAWTVTIEESEAPLPYPQQTEWTASTRAATWTEVSAVDPSQHGRGDYRGPLLEDLNFTEWSHSALVRIAEEVCLQQHLLSLSFAASARQRLSPEAALDLHRKQFVGIAGLTAERLRAALRAPADLAGLAAVLAVHPALNPRGYANASMIVGDDALRLRLDRSAPQVADGGWLSLVDAGHLEPIQAIANGVDPYLQVRVADEVADAAGALVLDVRRGPDSHPEYPEVQLTRFSTGARFAFVDRGRSLPLVTR